MKAQKLRELFINFFVERGHEHVPSSPLVPVGDPTLLFTTAGMVQFKPLWAGTVELPYTRATTIQKCLRLSDLENVGYTPRHDTFFEMLGNFSFGDYFKEEAISWAWEFLTDVLKIPKERLWVTVYKDDNESYDIWKNKIGIPENKIVKLGDEDNFWGPAGKTGACGPCSEIIYDMGEDQGCGKPDCKPGCDCFRWLEVWNLVFPQYDQQEDGTRLPLKNRGIDTGMGLERLAMIMQGKENIFETDLFFPIIQAISNKTGIKYKEDTKKDIAMKIIADHIRALTFTISEDVTPSNEGRGYILRRLLRRASKYGKDLGLNKPFLYELVDVVVDIMKKTYPELLPKVTFVKQIIKSEEEKFLKTIDQGIILINSLIEKAKSENKKIISGKDVFILYDTYGFPVEMTEEILRENGFSYNREEYEKALEKAKEIARKSWKGTTAVPEIMKIYKSFYDKFGATDFKGYEKFVTEGKVLIIHKNGKVLETATKEDGEIEIILDKTTFYAESGGQVADIGFLINDNCKIEITDVQKTPDNLFIHVGKIVKGILKTNDTVKTEINVSRRKEIMKHHTATHLLQSALREVLGTHVGQAGSYVCDKYLRFDFTHYKAITNRELELIAKKVNEYIQENYKVEKITTTLEKGKKMGALAFFGEKYGKIVRVIKIGEVSCEFCGGTHLDYTGQIGYFKIISESSISSGTRRIEAVAGLNAVNSAIEDEYIVKELSALLKVDKKQIVSSFEKLTDTLKKYEKEIQELKLKNIVSIADELIEKAEKIKDITLISKKFENINVKDLLPLVDRLRNKLKEKTIILFVSAVKGKVQLLVAVSKDLQKDYPAGKLVKELATVVGGGGGGRPDLAQAGGKDIQKIPEVMEKIKTLI